MGPDAVNILPLSHRPLPNENAMVVLGLHILISLEDAQLSYLPLHHCFSNPDCIWKIHTYLYVYFLIYCLSSPLEYIIQESRDLCVTLRTATPEPSGTQ